MAIYREKAVTNKCISKHYRAGGETLVIVERGSENGNRRLSLKDLFKGAIKALLWG